MDTLKKGTTKPIKAYNVQIKPRHVKVIRNLVENGGNKYKAIKDAGYSEALATSPQKVTESRSFIQAMNEMGLSDDYLNGCLLSDIRAKKQNRLGELTLAYKLKGKLKDTVAENKTLILITSGESANRYKAIDTPHSPDSV